jgi:predicted acetyltransferase
MEPEIRPARAEEMEEFTRCVRTGFGLYQDFKLDLQPDWTLCAFSDGKLATSYAAWPLTMQFDKEKLKVAGVTMVSTLPAYRRRNYLRKVTEAHFQRLHEGGERSITALFASMAAIYQRYGYAVVSTRNGYSIEPQYLRFAMDIPVNGSFQEADEKDQGLMLELYHRCISGKVGRLHRGEGMQVAPGTSFFSVWNSRPPALPAIKLLYREAGIPTGYVIYSQVRDLSQGNPSGQRLVIHDLVWLSVQAYYAIWDLFSNMDLVYRIEWGKAPPDDPLPHLLLEPRKLNVTSADGMLARIVDIERALPLRRYQGEGVLTFEVIDDLCPWNRGNWELNISPRGCQVLRTTREAQMKIPVSTLAMLFFGQISASQAAGMGRLEVNQSGFLPLWDELLRTPSRPFCDDSF